MPPDASASVAMCTFDGERFLGRQLRSIAEQSRLPNEVVICDDGSGDRSLAIIRAFAARAPFPVRLESNAQQLGSTKNFEKAIGLCSGDLIFLADQDDEWRRDKIETMTREFEDHPDLLCLFTDARIIDEQGAVASRSLWQHAGFGDEQREEVRGGRAFELLVVRNFATGATMAFRAGYRDLLLPIPAAHAMVHDRWIALVLSLAGRIGFCTDTLVDYRKHGRQQIGPEDNGVSSRIRAILRTGRAQFEEWAGQLQLVDDRLTGYEGGRHEERLLTVRERAEHLRSRASLPDRLVRRLPRVMEELRTGRYHRHSNGLLSAAKDIFRAFHE